MSNIASGPRSRRPVVVATALLSLAAACSKPANDGGAGTTTVGGQPAATSQDFGPPLDTAELVSRTEPSVALVKGKLGAGTGFLVGHGLLATNAHVIDEEFIEGIQVLFPSAPGTEKGPLGAQLLYEDAARDLALLYVGTNLPALALAPNYQFRKGEEITVIGNPGIGDEEVLENAISRGVMSSQVNIEGKPYYQLGIAINPGNSGGPVFNQRGYVVGVASKKATKQEALAFCIPSADLDAAIRLVTSRPPTDAVAVASRHRLANTFRLLGIGGVFYGVGLDVHRIAREKGPQYVVHAGEENVGLDKFDKAIDTFDQRAFAPAKLQADGVRNDAQVDANTRTKISQLADNYAAMKALFSQPVGDLFSYRSQVTNLKNRHRQLIDELAKPLNVEIPPNLLKALQSDQGADPSAALAGATPRSFGPRSPFGSSPLQQRMEERRAESHQRMQDFRQRALNRSGRRGLR